MSETLFHANCIAVEDSDESCLVGFADQEYDTQRYLQLQRAHVNDAQDQALGLDTYYVERDDQRNSCYGGIECCDLHADKIRLSFSDAGSRSLNLREPMRISFDIDEEKLNAVRILLATIFSGTQCLRDHTSE
jgi:hypothetical protein